MTAPKPPRTGRPAGYRPSALTSTGRPRKVADSRRAAVRSAAGTTPGTGALEPEPGTAEQGTGPGGSPAVETPVAAQGHRGATASPEAGRAQEEEAAERRPARFRVTRLTVALLGAATVLTVAVALLGWDLTRMDARANAREAGQVVATESMETILSYDHAHYDKGVAAAKTLMTGEFAKKYADTVATVRSRVLETGSVVKAEVVASSVVSAEPDEVRTLLFVNQTTTGKQVQEPRVDLNRVVVTLVREDDAWLVSDVDAL